MGDAAQSNTRNLYQKKFAFLEYRDGAGRSYAEQIRLQSWMNADDIPPQAQPSARAQVEGGGYDILHPNVKSILPESCYAQTHGARRVALEADPRLPVHERLHTPSRTIRHTSARATTSRPELEGDEAFQAGMISAAIAKYSKAISESPALIVFVKRCAAFAHVGKYQAALADAKYILSREDSAKAAHRVGAIEKFLKNQALCAPGFQNSHITLCLAVTPRELRQWRGKGPSLYGY